MNEITEIKGNVCIEYRDELTGRIKERIASKNHIFEDSFRSGNWSDILNNTSYENLFITDDNSPPDDNLPYLRGNIVGWGRTNTAASGLYQGNYITDKSWLDRDINNGMGRSWKWTYEFSSSQLPGEMKSVGITNQYATCNSDFLLLPVRGRRYYTAATAYFYRNGKGYRAANTGIITVYDPFTNTSDAINISAITGTASTLCIGFAVDSQNAFILAYSSTAANRRIYRFMDESFDTLLETYSYSTITNYPSSNFMFAVYGDRLWYYSSSGWFSGNYTANENPTLIATPACVFNANLTSVDSNTSMTVKEGKVFCFKEVSSSSKARFSIWDLEKNEQFITMSPTFSSSTPQHCPQDPALSGRVFLLSHNSQQKFFMKQALCCYTIPDDAPIRPDDTAVSVSYQIDIGY